MIEKLAASVTEQVEQARAGNHGIKAPSSSSARCPIASRTGRADASACCL
jgi:hypothetical protein